MMAEKGRLVLIADIAGIGSVSGELTMKELELRKTIFACPTFEEVKQPVTTKPVAAGNGEDKGATTEKDK